MKCDVYEMGESKEVDPRTLSDETQALWYRCHREQPPDVMFEAYQRLTGRA